MMPDPGSFDAIDAIANAVAARLSGRMPGVPGLPGLPGGPAGEPDLELPPSFDRPQLNRPGLLPTRHLAITGIELTQSIQHFNAGGRGYGHDNSVPLIALKTLVARVYPYVSTGMPWPDALIGARVTGELVMSVGNRVVYRTGPTRSGGTRVGRIQDLDRTLWDAEFDAILPADRYSLVAAHWNPPLNFIVPAWYCRAGRAAVSVRIWRIEADGSASTRDTATAAERASFVDLIAPRVCLVRVNCRSERGPAASSAMNSSKRVVVDGSRRVESCRCSATTFPSRQLRIVSGDAEETPRPWRSFSDVSR
jgi:hypothetical protein